MIQTSFAFGLKMRGIKMLMALLMRHSDALLQYCHQSNRALSSTIFGKPFMLFEFRLSEERGKTIRLSRTRQKVSRVGVIQTLKDWALDKKQTEGFKMLLDRGMPDLTGEAIILRHCDKFEADIQSAARDRLLRAGVDVERLPTSLSK